MKNKKASRIARYIIIVLLCLILVPFTAIAIAHAVIFRRCDYGSYDTRRYLTHDEIDHEQYPYETQEIPSGDHNLTGFLYGASNTNGLIVLRPGHTDTTDIKLYETLSFVDAGWTVSRMTTPAATTARAHRRTATPSPFTISMPSSPASRTSLASPTYHLSSSVIASVPTRPPLSLPTDTTSTPRS